MHSSRFLTLIFAGFVSFALQSCNTFVGDGDEDATPPEGGMSGDINETDTEIAIRVKAGGAPTTIWLHPELVEFDKKINVYVTGFRPPRLPEVDISVMLEDARTRGDRMHPFWARVDVPEVRRAGSGGVSSTTGRRTAWPTTPSSASWKTTPGACGCPPTAA